MKITMSAYDVTTSWENIYNDITIEEILKGVVSCLRGLTFSENTIVEGIANYLDEILDKAGEC